MYHRFTLSFSLIIYEKHLTWREIFFLSLTSKTLFNVVSDCLYELPIIWNNLRSQRIFRFMRSFINIDRLVVLSFYDAQFFVEDEESCHFFSKLKSLEIVNNHQESRYNITCASGLSPKFNSLQYLRLQSLALNDIGYSRLIENSANLQNLHFNQCACLTIFTIANSVENFTATKCLELRSLSILEGSSLCHLSVTHCPAFRDIKGIVSSSLQSCDFSGTLIETGPLERLIVSCPHLSCLTANNCRKLFGSLLIESCSLVSISFQMCPIETLLVACNAVLELDLTLCRSMTALYISANKLSTLKLQVLSNLVLLRLLCKRLCRLDVSGCRNLFETSKVERLLTTLSFNESPATDTSDFNTDATSTAVRKMKLRVVREAFFSERSHSASGFVSEMRCNSPSLDWRTFWRTGIAGCFSLFSLPEVGRDLAGYDPSGDRTLVAAEKVLMLSNSDATGTRRRKPRSSSV